MEDQQRCTRLLRRSEVERRTGLSRSSIYDRLDPKSPRHDESFPRPVQVGMRAKRFVEAQVDAWIAGLISPGKGGVQ